MDIAQLITIFAIVATNITTIITLYLHLDNKTSKTLEAIQSEIRDFHGRLCAIEEKNKGK